MKITSILFLLSIGFTALGKPNVLIIMTDDQGYPEVSAHGNPVLQTPNLDRLHGQSLRLSDYHVAPMCTPTRGQLLTGLDAARNGAVNVSSGRALIRAEVPIMANYFGDAGYSTGVFGKWHLGANYPYRPQDRGFQEIRSRLRRQLDQHLKSTGDPRLTGTPVLWDYYPFYRAPKFPGWKVDPMPAEFQKAHKEK